MYNYYVYGRFIYTARSPVQFFGTLLNVMWKSTPLAALFRLIHPGKKLEKLINSILFVKLTYFDSIESFSVATRYEFTSAVIEINDGN